MTASADVTPINDTVEYVTVLNYTVTELYATSLYTSCKDVKSPATNAPALDVMCGSSDCSPHVSLEKYI